MATIGVNTLFLIPGEVGGSETVLRGILAAAVPLRRDVTWTLFTNLENDAYFRALLGAACNVEFQQLRLRARSRPLRILSEQLELPRRARRAGVDVLWSPGYTAPLRAACPQVVSVLDMQYCEFPQDLSLGGRLASALLIPAAARRSQGIITLSAFSRDQIVRYAAVPSERIQVIPAGVEPEFGSAQPEHERARRLAACLPDAAPYWLCVANTYPHKNVPALIAAFGQVDPPGRRLVLVGGPGRGEVEVCEAIARLPHPARVTRLRGLAQADLVALYQGAEWFVFPSLYEGFGLPVLEAMAAGTPVLAAAAASIPEVGGDGIRYCDGSSSSLTEALRQILEMSPADRAALVDRARRIAAEFTWEAAARRTLECLLAVRERVPRTRESARRH
jgi:glycosyltransferase involved in cell wall biosynthesis